MAKIRSTSLLILFLVATFCQCALGFHNLYGSVGTDNMLNNAGDMTIRTLALSVSIQSPDPGDVPFPNGQSYEYVVEFGITSVTSWCKMTNATGRYDQKVLSWSVDPTKVQPIPCGPDCEWTINACGFWVTNPVNQQLEFVQGWNGPISG